MKSNSSPLATGGGVVATLALMLGSALSGVFLHATWSNYLKKKKKRNPEADYTVSQEIVDTCLREAMNSSMLYIGDKLELYGTLRECCGKEPTSSVTSSELAEITGYHERWLREWLAQQTAMGVLQLMPGDQDDSALRYRLPKATAQVLANPDSKQYCISMISVIPSLVNRAKTMLPKAFQTGIGQPYNNKDVARGIDRHHATHVRDVFLPQVIPQAARGKVLKMLQDGCTVADLGCGGGNLLLGMARQFPKSRFHGYEVSQEALTVAAYNVTKSKLRNVFLHDANDDSFGNHKEEYDVLTTYDVLHDASNPSDLIAQARRALKRNGGVWILGDIPCAPSIRENIEQNAKSAARYWSFSVSLCLACSLSMPNGAGLGTLGFSVPLAKKMLIEDGGFQNVKILLETSNIRWFEVM